MTRTITPQRLDPKDPDEEVFVRFDFAALTATPSAPEVTSARHAGEADSSPASIRSGQPTVSGSAVLQKVVGGIDGTDYLLRCLASAPDGSKYVLTGVLPVRGA